MRHAIGRIYAMRPKISVWLQRFKQWQRIWQDDATQQPARNPIRIWKFDFYLHLRPYLQRIRANATRVFPFLHLLPLMNMRRGWQHETGSWLWDKLTHEKLDNKPSALTKVKSVKYITPSCDVLPWGYLTFYYFCPRTSMKRIYIFLHANTLK